MKASPHANMYPYSGISFIPPIIFFNQTRDLFFGTKKSTEPKKKETKRLIEHSEARKHQKCHQKGGVEAL